MLRELDELTTSTEVVFVCLQKEWYCIGQTTSEHHYQDEISVLCLLTQAVKVPSVGRADSKGFVSYNNTPLPSQILSIPKCMSNNPIFYQITFTSSHDKVALSLQMVQAASTYYNSTLMIIQYNHFLHCFLLHLFCSCMQMHRWYRQDRDKLNAKLLCPTGVKIVKDTNQEIKMHGIDRIYSRLGRFFNRKFSSLVKGTMPNKHVIKSMRT